jgi:ABC-type multidrug transport system ATPase subunit
VTFELSARQIRKSFGGVEVLHGVDLDALGGSVLALLGENGAGKSTMVKIIAGDYQADAGEVVIDSTSYAVLTPRLLGMRPSEMFSATVSVEASWNSWKMMATPRSRAWRGVSTA